LVIIKFDLEDTMVTLEQTLDDFDELSLEEQNLLTEIINKRSIENKRKLILDEAEQSLKEYQAGMYESLTAKEAIEKLRKCREVE
jgi:hypothetical protein